MTNWVMYDQEGQCLGVGADWSAVDPEAAAVVMQQADGPTEFWLAREHAPEHLINLNGKGHGRWVCLHGTARLGDYGGGRVFWGEDAFLRQVDLAPQYAWMTPLLVQLPVLAEPRVLRIEGESIWAWRAGGQRFYLYGDGPDWGLYGAGNTSESVLCELEDGRVWSAPEDLLLAAGALRLSQRL